MKSVSVYITYDRTAERFGLPVLYPNDTVALRSFKEFMEKNNLDSKDFILYKISDPIVEPSTEEDLPDCTEIVFAEDDEVLIAGDLVEKK